MILLSVQGSLGVRDIIAIDAKILRINMPFSPSCDNVLALSCCQIDLAHSPIPNARHTSVSPRSPLCTLKM
jgi:hypothetical protein